MSLLQTNHRQDLRELREIGYNVSIVGNYLVVRDIPYVNSLKQICRGILVSKLDVAGDQVDDPKDHTIMFGGDYPCDANGSPLDMLSNSQQKGKTILDKNVEVHYTFSRKPLKGHYDNYYQKIDTYVGLIVREARIIDPDVTALTHQVVDVSEDEDFPFNYPDTFSSRAEINIISQKLASDKVAIIGVGGTGSYVLDLVAKTPVKEIHLIDADVFLTHNAFRAPGAPSVEELRQQPSKVAYLQTVYSKMKRRITIHEMPIDSTTVDFLEEMTFVFLCFDPGPEKQLVVEKLEQWDIPFIDVGIGLYRKADSLGGKVRVTTSIPGHREAARKHLPLSDGGQGEYDKNIQIADLNALNACLAVIKWKKLRGFYIDSEHEQFTSYTLGLNQLNDDTEETEENPEA